jgi:adenylate cyclase
MPDPAPRRRLAAILAMDVVGYSRLMAADEAGTLDRFKRLRAEIIEPPLAALGGRVVGSAGDSLLIELASAHEAVAFAVQVQRHIAVRNQGLPADRHMLFRVGINLGDVIAEGDTIHGDGVNVAARLEKLAEAGGIVIGRAVHDQVRGKLGLAFHDLGDQLVHNIPEPVRAFRVNVAEEGPSAAVAAPGAPRRPDVERPSIAVLPFVNMSADAEQDYFADGITEDILTELSRFRHLLVISRNSSFFYKGKPVKVQEVARELDVAYVLEGSVRRAGNRVRVTAQLIEATTDQHIWAERYDRELADIFAIQDELTSAIVAVLPGRIEASAQRRVERKPIENLAAYECVLEGKVLHHRATREANAHAQAALDRAIALDPKYAHAYAWKACVLGQAWSRKWDDNPERLIPVIVETIDAALALDENDSDVHRILAALAIMRDQFDKADRHQTRAVALNPNDDLIVVQQGELLTWLGRAEEGIEWIRKAMRLNPYHPERFWSHLGRACFVARRYDDAIAAFKRISAPDHTHHAFLAAAHAAKGDAGAAAEPAARVLAAQPSFTVGAHLAGMHYARAADREHHEAALLAAGLPA